MKGSALLAILLFGFASPAHAEEAKVSYVSGKTVCLDAGLDRGLAEGDFVEVVRDGQVVVFPKEVAEFSRNARQSVQEPLGLGLLMIY